jgi:hypothetical protein
VALLALGSCCHAQARADPGPPDSGGVARWSREEGFRIESADGNYRLRFGLITGLKIEPAWNAGERTVNGVLAFLQPKLSGTFYRPWLSYAIAMELAQGDAYLRDAYIAFQPLEEFGACFGKQGTLISRHEAFNQTQIFFPDYASVAGYFWSGREKGLMVYGSAFDRELDYYLGLYGSAPLRDPLNDPDHYILEARVTASPLGPINDSELPSTFGGGSLPLRASFTLQGYHGKLNASAETESPTQGVLTPEPFDTAQKMTTFGGDLWVQGGPVIVFGEYFARHIEDSDVLPGYSSHGVWGQVVVDVYERLIGAGVRANYLDPKLDLDDDRVVELEGQLAWLIHPPELVLKASYSYLHQDSPDAETLDDFELPFVPGSSHVLTLQITLAL